MPVFHRCNAHFGSQVLPKILAVALADLGNEAEEKSVMSFALGGSQDSEFGFIHEGSPVTLIDVQIASLSAQFNAAGWPLAQAGAQA
ncbi:MAG TPA: hypothetical protein PL117_16030 [Accumulibacter sp.]|uniref:hypothetical protein n=1 Tax=Accumulibacter sp. TaxID=2053492 RepID=UPI002C3E9C54|nr:hypothetical protein [Accumulibacter sp.]HRF74274.1 hypothetical protein [Accumulibacter sp.]